MAKKKSRKPAAAPTRKTGQPESTKRTKSTKKSNPAKKSDDQRQRLQRVMASAGVGSRRECELIIEEGRVEVDGEVVMTLGAKVDPHKQVIYVDAQKLVIQRLQYFILNKPPGVLSTSKDPAGRPRVIDLIKTDKRVYNVGRLDQSSEGLILVTNDGDLANQLTHPRYGVEKKYHVQVVGVPAAADLRKLEEGVYIAEGLARASKAKFLKRAPSGCWLEITLAEGRNREIRRMLAGIGHKVRTLKRVSIGPLKLGDLPLGAHRPLSPMEIKMLKNASSEIPRPKPRKPTKTGATKAGATGNPGSTKSKSAQSKNNGSDDSRGRQSESPRKTSRHSPGKKPNPRRGSTAEARGASRGSKKSSKKKSVSIKPRRGGTNPKKRGGKR
jgi:23S rRNA pseudouridine2605 synthase